MIYSTALFFALFFSLYLSFVRDVTSFPDQTNVQINVCKGGDRQQWIIENDQTIRLKSDGKCLDISGYGTTEGSNVWLYTCHTSDKDPKHQNQEWKINSDESITSTMSGMCLDVSDYSVSPGGNVQIWECTKADNQKWIYNTQNQTFVGVQSGLCLDAGSATPAPCDNSQNKDLPFCNTSLSIADRAKDLVSRIAMADKVKLFINGSPGVSSPYVPAYQWWSEALHGIAGSPGVHFGGTTPHATSFPTGCSMGSTFDMDLVHEMATVISTEGRGMNTEGNAGLTFWAPNVNIVRDPRWGRAQETPGEDPYLTAHYAKNYVTGMQEGEDSKHLKVSSCCKHYLDYNLEDFGGVDRHHFNAITSEQDQTDTYLPAFKSCVVDGKASSLMCSYNAVNGVPSCANPKYMNDLAVKQWDFEGYITSDCGAVSDIINAHKYTSSPDQTCKLSLEAGMDIDCGSYLKDHLAAAVSDGTVSSQDVDHALQDLFMVRLRLGEFDPYDTQPYRKLDHTDVNTPAHQALALKAAQECVVLLKNDGALPLSNSTVKSVAVVGPNGDATKVMQGNYYGSAPYLISPVDAIKAYTSASYTKGCDIDSTDTSGFDAACTAAQGADATVVVVGLDQTQEREGHDRTTIDLPGVQNDFITKMGTCSKGPLVVVVMAGSSCDLSVPKNDKNVNAIFYVGYPGQSGGVGIADSIFGAYNPGGRIPFTIYPKSFADDVSMFSMDMRPNATNKSPGRTYRFYTGTPVYEFGTGLSYTTFKYSWSTIDTVKIEKEFLESKLKGRSDFVYSSVSGVVATVNVTVTNTGNRAGDDVVLAFMTPPNPGKNGNPLKYLFGFTRINLKPNESKDLVFPVSIDDITLIDKVGDRVALAGHWKVVVGDIEQSITVY